MDIVLSLVALAGFVALTVATGFFVAIEFALTGLERSTIDQHATTVGDATAKAIKKSHDNLSFELSGAQLGITITTLATGYLAEPVLARYIGPLLDLTGLPHTVTSPIALIVALIIATFLSMVYGELVPKNMAITDPLAAARLTVRPVRAFNALLRPFITGLNWLANALVRKMGIEPADELASARSAQELGALVRNSAKHGGLEQAKAIMLDKSLKFGDATADDFMTPRSTIEHLDVNDSVEDLLKLALETGHSRFPVTDGDLDATMGVVHVKDAFAVAKPRRGHTLLASLARPVPVVPATLDGDAVLNAVRSAGSQVVLVADEYGGTAGMVTIEDLVEEILGPVYDEHDDADGDRDFIASGKSWDVAGLVRIDELPDKTGYHAPDGPYETFAGLIMWKLGRIPRVGDTVVLPETTHDMMDEFESGITGRWVARVTVMDDRRIDRAFLTPVTNDEAKKLEQSTADHMTAEQP